MPLKILFVLPPRETDMTQIADSKLGVFTNLKIYPYRQSFLRHIANELTLQTEEHYQTINNQYQYVNIGAHSFYLILNKTQHRYFDLL